MKTPLVFVSVVAALSSAPVCAEPPAQAAYAPAYEADGRLKLPADYREWIFLSSGIDMSYRARPGMRDHSMFDNVFVDPEAYRAFVTTGRWPDRTTLVMEVRGAATEGSINHGGKFQTVDRMGVEVHVKDTQRFDGGWVFFVFDDTQSAREIPPAAECYACHRQHGAVDTTFVQFYPTLSGIAAKALPASESPSSPVPAVDAVHRHR